MSRIPYVLLLPKTLASYWNVMIRARGSFSGRRSRSQYVPDLAFVHELTQWPLIPWMATTLCGCISIDERPDRDIKPSGQGGWNEHTLVHLVWVLPRRCSLLQDIAPVHLFWRSRYLRRALRVLGEMAF